MNKSNPNKKNLKYQEMKKFYIYLSFFEEDKDPFNFLTYESDFILF